MAYTMILVDDEDDVRGRIASKMSDRPEFQVIGSASNGYDALDLLEETVPDVVVTDIKMPFIDGIELTRIIKDRYPTVKVAIISGYDDYTYLKEAINLDVVAYLSKPISKDKIDDFLTKISQSLEAENQHILLKENMVINQVRDRVIHHFIGETNPQMKDQSVLSQVGIHSNGPYVLASIRLMNLPSHIIDGEKRRHQCYQMVEELVEDAFTAYHSIYNKDIVTIIEVEGHDFNKKLDLVLFKIVGYFDKYLDQPVTLGISEQGGIEGLSQLYRQSQMTLEGHSQVDQNTINYFKDLEIDFKQKNLSKEDIHAISQSMLYMDQESFKTYMEALGQRISQDHNYDYFSLMISISSQLIEYADSIGAGAANGLDISLLKQFIDQRSLNEFLSLVVHLRNHILADVTTKKVQKSMSFMARIMDYIDQNFQRLDISMEHICDEFNISISYLCALFKKETETTFNKYLVSKRIGHAKVLLENTDKKMVAVAEACGYKDVYYFSHSFKKSTGQSPKEFRKHAQT